MILNFSSKHAEDIFDGSLTRHARKIPMDIHNRARKLLDQLNAAYKIDDLRSPPGNRLELLKGSLAGKWSIRINQQWRVIFDWTEGHAENVDIADYH